MARLKPWEPLTASCDRCPSVATRRVVVQGIPDVRQEKDGTVSLELGANERPDLEAALACETHADEVTAELCDTHGAAVSAPLRSSWRYWFLTETTLGRPIDRVLVAIHNWRFERGVEGKRFGFRMQTFSIDPDS